MNALFDTNIIVDYLNGIEHARTELRRYERVFISPITFIEVLVGTPPLDEPAVRAFLARFSTKDLSPPTLEAAIRIRRDQRVRIPDALVWAAAEVNGLILVTRNTKDFPPHHPGIRVPYSLS